MKLATWNVNSLRARLGRVEEWLAANEPDVLVMQETKCDDAAFPAGAFKLLGYDTVHHGNGRWNGVAIASRIGLEEIRAGFSGEDAPSIEECRIVQARCGELRVFSVYVPNGRVVDSEFYVAKLAFLKRLREELETTGDPDEPIAVCGDFNVAPEDRDVWDIAAFEGATHVTEPERAAVRALEEWGLSDALRSLHPDEVGPFSWWDYRAGNFHKGYGMRIDLALVSRPLRERLVAAYVDRDARKGKLPSDHAPVVVEFSD